MATPLGGTPIQDMPPSGGFKAFNYKRAIPNKGPGPVVLSGGAIAAVVGGFYLIGQGNRANGERALEKRLARANIVPFLQAEEDKRYVAALKVKKAREKEIMKDVPNWDVDKKLFHGRRWLPPATNDPNLA